LRYSDFTTVSKQEVNPYSALDNVLLEKVKDLFTKLYKKGEKVRLLGVKFSHLVPMTLQMNLFDKEAERLQLFKTVDKIKAQFGVDAVKKASGVLKNEKENMSTDKTVSRFALSKQKDPKKNK